MKKIIAAALVLVMLFSLSVSASAATVTTAGNMTDQLELLYRNFSTLKQDDTPTVWYYAVTDLDHNGRLELLAVTTTSDLRNDAKLKGWEVSQDGQRIEPVKHEFSDAADPAMKDGFPNIMTDSADTYYDDAAKMWTYVFTDYSELSHDLTPEESAQANGMQHVNTAITSTYGLSKHDDHFDRGVLGVKLVTIIDGKTEISFIDKDGKEMTEDQFLSVGTTAFAGKQRSNTGFDWFPASEATSQDRFVKSYSVFDNTLAAGRENRPNTAPTALSLAVTKNPTNETRNAGETALFIADALNYTSCTWSFVDPSGNVKTPGEFMASCGGSVVGENSTRLSVSNVNTGMNGWGVFCTFRQNNQSARTTTAYIYTRFAQEQLKNKNVTDFYTTWAWLYGTWICPLCGSEVWGDYCPYCGFDPDYYYYYYFNDYVDPSIIIPYGYTGSGSLDGYTGSGSFDAWYCPLCGSSNTGTICWNCGYDPVMGYIPGSGYGVFDGGYTGSGTLDGGITGSGSFYDGYTGSGSFDGGYTGSGSFDVDWYCPMCGVGNVGTSICWNCGYSRGSEVVSVWNEPVYDYWNDSYGYGEGSWDDYGWDW